MPSSYEFWLTDDAGRKIAQLDKYSFVSYSRTTNGFGTIQMGIPYEYHKERVPEIFQLDWRIDVWRAAEENFPSRREGSFFLMKHVIYERIDGVEIIEFFGRSPIEILRRFPIILNSTNYTATDYADDIMKDIITTELLVNISNWGPVPDEPQGSGLYPEFKVEEDKSLGPSISVKFNWGENILDIIKSIKKTTFEKAAVDSTISRIYFDVIEGPGLPGGFGYVFKTYAGLRGQDRTDSGLVFSTQNGNLAKPSYYEDYLDAINRAGIRLSDLSDGSDTLGSEYNKHSRWNRVMEGRIGGDTVAEMESITYSMLAAKVPQRVLNADFLNTPGGPNQPRSLYGVDWDMGDLIRAEFADKSFDVEIKIVYVSVDENGKENVLGSSEIAQ